MMKLKSDNNGYKEYKTLRDVSVQVNMAGRMMESLLNNTVCRTVYKGCILQQTWC